MVMNPGAPNDPEHIFIDDARQDDCEEWQPAKGGELINLLSALPEASRDRVEEEAISILRHCVPPNVPSRQETVLVVGYVQSGKTMSFEAVSALARDNRYQLVIVLTGISKILLEQSSDRLKGDLRLAGGNRAWKSYVNPTVRHDRRSIESALHRWRDPSVPEHDRQTILIAVMKNHSHLRHLNELLGSLSLDGVPTIVIDDEADQAGLNNQARRSGQSPTYRQLVELRRLLPHHTYLQYTATPQAPLLIDLIDVLSPTFAEVLTPGDDYTGGDVFFQQELDLVRPIPADQIPPRGTRLVEPPDCLLEALRVFFLGVAAGLVLGPPPNNRTMMIHPAKETAEHADYLHWVSQVMARWQRTLAKQPDDRDRRELVTQFEAAYNDLARTVRDLPAFERLLETLGRAIRETVPMAINARQQRGTPQPNWNRDYAHILVGGTALDRGYTVEGLTVTYMPRGQGVGNADTIQQRARWFGYKAGYLGYCRVYLSAQAIRAYRSYVEHEEDVRRRLREHGATGRPLREWRHAFHLSPQFRPTRNSVLNLGYRRGTFGGQWTATRAPHESNAVIEENRLVVARFLTNLDFVPDTRTRNRTNEHRHLVATGVPLDLLRRELLAPFRLSRPGDVHRFNELVMQLGRYLEAHPDANCTVYWMSPDRSISNPRTRSLDSSGAIENLFQGPIPDASGRDYSGDTKVRAEQGMTVQLHFVSLRMRPSTPIICDDVPALAVWVPRGMARDFIYQEQGGDE